MNQVRIVVQLIDKNGQSETMADTLQGWPISAAVEIAVDDNFSLYVRSKSTLHRDSLPDGFD